MKGVYSLILLTCVTLSRAWLPADKDLFNTTEEYYSADNGKLVRKWLPGRDNGKIRGVNLGSLFIYEPWMAKNRWNDMGCGDRNNPDSGTDAKSEFDCVLKLGQDRADTVFGNHWDTWITQDDLNQMSDLGLNTIRVPLGYWIFEDIVFKDSEHFPRGQLSRLEKICEWAANLGFYIILELHGAPGAQKAQEPFTGQYAPTAGFYVNFQYERAYTFLQKLTELRHTNNAYRNVGMIEVLNEPISNVPGSFISDYYPTAYNKIREVENRLGKAPNDQLHVQFMNTNWGSGDPASHLPNGEFTFQAAYDYHRYVGFSDTPVDQGSYVRASCGDNISSDNRRPVVVGETSLHTKDNAWDPYDGANKGFYQRWWSAQAGAYEKELGWIFWSWKNAGDDRLDNGRIDPRWSYRGAVDNGLIIGKAWEPAQRFNEVCSSTHKLDTGDM